MSRVLFHGGTVITGNSAMERCDVLVEDGRIADVFGERRFSKKTFDDATRILDASGLYVSPGFIDTHIHGLEGRGTDERGGDSALAMSASLAKAGVTAFCPTLYAAPRPELLERAADIAGVMGREEGARIMGLHLEGPFISPKRLGAQRQGASSPVDLDYMDELWRASRGRIVNMTVAPELTGMRELALYCLEKGIVLQAGHTDASYENMVEGTQVGILHATHLFNAMSALDHRNPNAAGAVLVRQEMSCEIVADGRHVHPDLVRLLVRDKPVERIVLVTDSIRPAGLPEGRGTANGEEVEYVDGAFRRTADGVLAGSALTMAKGIATLRECGLSLPEAVMTATANPARVMRFRNKGSLLPGYDADVTLFDASFRVAATMIGGRMVFDALETDRHV